MDVFENKNKRYRKQLTKLGGNKDLRSLFMSFANLKSRALSRAPTLRDRGSLLFLLGERREKPLPATAPFFDLAAVHGQGRISFKRPAFDKFKTGFEFAHGRRESKRWLKTLTRT